MMHDSTQNQNVNSKERQGKVRFEDFSYKYKTVYSH